MLRAALAAAVLVVLAAGCIRQPACFRDADCPREDVCYFDQHCLPREVAGRAGAPLGAECVTDRECVAPAFCRAGYCQGGIEHDAPVVDARPVDAPARPDAPRDAARPDAPRLPDARGNDADVTPPDFAGLQGVDPDGDGALLAYWSFPLDDHTLPLLIDVQVYRGTTALDLSTPIATVRGDRVFRDTGLVAGQSYVYLARARDEAGNVDRNGRTWSATVRRPPVVAPGVDFRTQVLPIFGSRCTLCHGGSSGLTLTSHAALLAGGVHGPVVLPCDPDASNLIQKLGPTPPFGVRMPRSGPPYLSLEEMAILHQWIVDGAGETYDPAACTPRDGGARDGGADGGVADAGPRDGPALDGQGRDGPPRDGPVTPPRRRP